MISVLMPVRNGAKTLDTALASIENQTLNDIECIVVDDGSTDSTAAIVTKFAENGIKSLRLVRTPGLGIAKALNIGLSHCNRQWIARMDADDISHPERLEKQLALAHSDSKLALIGCQILHDSQGIVSNQNTEGMRRHVGWANSITSHSELALAIWIDSPLPHPSWLVHKRAFDTIGIYNELDGIPEDYEWLHRFFGCDSNGTSDLKASKVTGAPLLNWTDHPQRLTRTQSAYSTEAFNQVKVASLKAFVKRNEIDEIHVFGLGPKGKSIVQLAAKNGLVIRSIVDVSPRREGTFYHGIEVMGVERWKLAQRSSRSLALICLGTIEARSACEKLCESIGLCKGISYLSL